VEIWVKTAGSGNLKEAQNCRPRKIFAKGEAPSYVITDSLTSYTDVFAKDLTLAARAPHQNQFLKGRLFINCYCIIYRVNYEGRRQAAGTLEYRTANEPS